MDETNTLKHFCDLVIVYVAGLYLMYCLARFIWWGVGRAFALAKKEPRHHKGRRGSGD